MEGAQCSERVQDRGKGLERSRRGGQEPLRIPIAAAVSPCSRLQECRPSCRRGLAPETASGPRAGTRVHRCPPQGP